MFILDFIFKLYFGALIGFFTVPIVLYILDTDYAINYYFTDGYNKNGW